MPGIVKFIADVAEMHVSSAAKFHGRVTAELSNTETYGRSVSRNKYQLDSSESRCFVGCLLLLVSLRVSKSGDPNSESIGRGEKET